jgi:single-stranded-DNA-specific exonuclease
LSEKALAEFIEEYRSLVIIPDTSLDSLLSASIMYKKLLEHGLDVKVSINHRIILDYPDDPAILLNLPGLNNSKHLSITRLDERSSTAATVVSILDKLVGVDKWDKLLAVIAGLYHGLYDFKSGLFQSIEDKYAKDLVNEKILVEVPGLRLWGARRLSLPASLARTLMPFIPGLTGNLDKAIKLVSEVFKVHDATQVKVKELRIDENKDSVLQLIKNLAEIERDPHFAFKLLGDFYINLQDPSGVLDVEAQEFIGALIVYNSLCRKCPEDILVSTIDKSIFTQILTIYDGSIDVVAREIAQSIDVVRRGGVASGLSTIERPDVLVDILAYMEWLPKDRVVKLTGDSGVYTVLRELLRVGVKPLDAYSSCGEDQVCTVKS